MIIPTFQIDSVEDVKSFFTWLLDNDLLLHPDDSFTSIVDFAEEEGEEPSISREQAEHIDNLMQKCFDICNEQGADIYELCMFCHD